MKHRLFALILFFTPTVLLAVPATLPVEGFNRSFALPIDSSSVWTNESELTSYASSVESYVGQVLTLVTENTNLTVYALDENKNLIEIGGSGLTFDTSNLLLRDGSNSLTNTLDFSGNNASNVTFIYFNDHGTNYTGTNFLGFDGIDLTFNGEPIWFSTISDTSLLTQIQGYYTLVQSNYDLTVSAINSATSALAVATNFTPKDVYTAATNALWLNFLNYATTTDLNTASNSLQTQIDGLVSGAPSLNDYVTKSNAQFVGGTIDFNSLNVINANEIYFGGSATNVLTFDNSTLKFNGADLLETPDLSVYASVSALNTASNSLQTQIDTLSSNTTDPANLTNYTLLTTFNNTNLSLQTQIDNLATGKADDSSLSSYTLLTDFNNSNTTLQTQLDTLSSEIDALPDTLPDPTNVVAKSGDQMFGTLDMTYKDIINVRGLYLGSPNTNVLSHNGQDLLFNGQPITSLATLPSAYVSHRDEMFTGGSATLTLSNNPYAEEAIFLFLNSGAQVAPNNYSFTPPNQITLNFPTTTDDIIHVKYLSADGEQAVYVDKFKQYYDAIIDLYALAADSNLVLNLSETVSKATNFQYISENISFVQYRDEVFTGGSSTLTLDYPPQTPSSVFVFLNSGAQIITNDYTVSGSTVTLGFNTTADDTILVKYLAFLGNDYSGLVGVGGGGGGSGAGFPLTNSPSANVSGNTFGVSNFGFVGFTGSTNTLYYNSAQNKLYFGPDPVGTGSGTGSGFPLTNNATANTGGTTFGISDLAFLDFTGSTGKLEFSSGKLNFAGVPVGSGEGSLKEIVANGVTNETVEALEFEAGNLMSITHTTNGSRSTVQIGFGGEVVGLTYRGEYSPFAEYSTNQFVTVTTFIGGTNDTPTPGQNLFRNAFLVKDDADIPFSNKNPSDTNYWEAFVSQGFPGADGVGNVFFDSVPWQIALPYNSNTIVQHNFDWYLSLQDINPATVTNASINNTNFWRKVLKSGEDGDDGVDTIETVYYLYTNQVVQGLTFIGEFDVTPPHPSFSSNDLVVYEGAAYFTPVDILSDPPTPPASPWVPFSAKGQDGSVAGNIVSNLLFASPIEYSTAATYPENSVIRFDNSLWYSVTNVDQSVEGGGAKQPPLNFTDSVTVTSNEYWNLLVPRGTRGASGGVVLDGVFKNDWNQFNPGGYNVNDLVYFDGGLWRCTQSQLSGFIQEPGVPSAFWELLIRSGTDGNIGTAFAYYGEWTSSGGGGVPKNWYTNNVVSYTPSNQRGGLWVCIQNHTGDQQPSQGSAFWQLIVADGLSATTLDLAYRGGFQIGAAYSTNDLVTYPTSGDFRFLWRPLLNIPSGNSVTPSAPNWEIVVSGLKGEPGDDGDKGDKGNKGDRGDDGADLVFKQEYNEALLYPSNSLVTYEKQVWFSKANVPGTNYPGVDPNLWGLFLEAGEDGEDGIGNMFFQGAWSTNRTYATNDLVQYSNAVYVALTNMSVATPPENTNFWLKLFEGVAGATGASVTNAQVVGTNLVITLSSGASITAGSVIGPKGDPGVGIGLTYEEAWTNNVAYGTNVLVTHLGSTFYSTAPSSNQAPPNASFWELFVERGDKGDTGPASTVPGPPGADLRFIDVWNATNVYAPSNLVHYAGGTWYANLASTNKVPGTAFEGYWSPFVSPAAPLIPSGNWTNVSSYSTNEIVFYNGSSYYSAITNNTSTPSPTSTTWRLLAQRGDDGLIQNVAWGGASNVWISVTTNNADVQLEFTTNFIDYLTTGVGGATNIVAGGTNDYDLSTRTLTWNTNDVKGFVWAPVSVSSNHTAIPYNFVLADTAATDIFITLPVASVSSGKVVAARKMSNNNTLYVKSASGDLVQGVGTVGVVRAGSVIEVISNGGTDWWLK